MTDAETAFRMEDDLYKPVEPAVPGGPNIQREDAFFAFRSLASPRPGRYDPINNVDLPPSPPDWSKVRPAGMQLLKKSKDCTVMVEMAKAELHEAGIAGFAGALDLIRHNLTSFWEDVHPEGDEDGDYWERVGVLRALADGGAFAKPLENVTLHVSRVAGPVTLRTLAIAAGNQTAKTGELALSASALDQLIAEENVAPVFAEVHRAAGVAKETLEEICTFVSAQDGSERLATPDPIAALDKLRAMLEPYLGSGAETAEVAAGEDEAQADATDDAAPTAPRPRAAAGDLKTRAEAVTVMNAIIDYYARTGRSSPVPLLLARLMELMDSSFSEVLEQIAPGTWEDAALGLAGLKAATPKPAAAGLDAAMMAAAGTRLSAAIGVVENAITNGLMLSPDEVAELRAAGDALRAATTPGGAESAPTPGGPIETPADVRSAVDRLVKHFEATDPNSVVPAFLRRAKPLVDRHFLDILKELAPEGAGGAKLLLHPRKV
ncbi:MAG: type VI secretion system protein ImpA [Paracoccaceae bacterium]|jgi:type VI secretion system protein ImpA